MTKEVSVFEGKKDIAARAERVGQGSENVRATDLAIPRIKLLQMISGEVDPASPDNLKGATAGMIMNSVSKELSTSLFLVNLHFNRATVVWRKRKNGGGMFGQYESEAEAIAALNEANEPVENFDISENPTHLVMIIDGETGENKGHALLDMPATKVKVSKRWNSLIQAEEAAGHPRFSCVWSLGVTSEKKPEGTFFNYTIDFVAHAPEEIYAEAQKAYDDFFGNTVSEAA